MLGLPPYALRRKLNGGLNRLSRTWQLRHALGLPYELQLVPTNACNLRCRACPKTHYPTDNRHLSPDVYERVKKELFPIVRILNLQGLGEPLLSPLFRRMVADAREYGLKIKFVTNAMMLDAPLMEEIVRAGADVTVSLDGACAETHEDSRTGSKFSVIMDALKELSRLSGEMGETGFHLSLNTVVTKRNVGELREIIEIGARNKISCLTLISPGVGEREDDYARDVISHFPDLLRREIPALAEAARKKGIQLFSPEFEDANKSGEKGGEPAGAKTARLFPGTCLDPWRSAYIDVDGWVRPCCRAVWIGMDNILEKPFRKIWNDVHYLRLREYVNSNNPPDFCRGCTLWWGITRGNELYTKELEARGVILPSPPQIGVADPSKGKAVI